MSSTETRPRDAEVVTKPEDAPLARESTIGERLLSIDALRGFNMFWIIGGEELISAIAAKIHNPTVSAISNCLTEHVEWEGFHFYDMIFPLFLFMIGVVIPFSLGRRKAEGAGRRRLVWKVVERTAVLFVLGWIYSGFFRFAGIEHFRLLGVLQRLALGYGFAAIIFLYAGVRAQATIAGALLVVYWLIMRWIPVPGHGAGDFSQYGNLANYIDRLVLLPGQMYERYGDPEGILSTIPAISTALLGVLAGQWLRSDASQSRKTRMLVFAGVASIALGYLWSIDFPVIKKIWTSSYVLVAGGWSMLLLALFYWVIDVRRWRSWTFPLVVIGMNPITIYIGQRIIDFDKIASFFVKGGLQFVPAAEPILWAFSVLLVKWLFLYVLYRKRIFMRV